MTGSSAISPGRVDWTSVMIYLLLVAMGWMNIYAAVYDESTIGFALSNRWVMQLIWIGVSLFTATAILLIDAKYYHMLAYPFYWITIAILVGVLFFGREVNGARAWISIGPVAIQPTEFVKFTTSLALAHFMSRYSFSVRNIGEVLKAGAIIMLPVLIICLQNDVGSAVVYAGFLLVFYREQMNGWVFVGVVMAIILFVLAFILMPFALLALTVAACVVGEALVNGRWRKTLVLLAAMALSTLLLYFGIPLLSGKPFPLFVSLLVSALAGCGFAIAYGYRHRLANVYMFVILFISSVGYTATVDYIFDNVLQEHQRRRILVLLGLESDLKVWGYNVNQSKIAIGSGGFTGKGYLEGTQTKFNFVPEQSTDFIFCTVGEEWGFVGSTVVVLLFMAMIVRLFRMGERQSEAFGRIYCYSVASIFFLHVVINIGMTIGIMPVIGIPLPFFSYGGSSLLAFTILFFVAVKLDSERREVMRHGF